MKGTDVCISTEAHINEAWTDAHIDNIDEEWMEVCSMDGGVYQSVEGVYPSGSMLI